MIPWLLHLLQMSDPLFPTGSYAHSFGLEGLVQQGVVTDAASLGRHLEQTVVPSLIHAELPFVAHAWRGDDTARIALDRLYAATKTSRELREASAAIGAQRLRLLARLHPSCQDLLSLGITHAPVVWGAQCACLDVPVESALTAYHYQTVSSVLVAAPKLIRIGQTACQELLTKALETTSSAVAAALAIPIEEAGWFTPTLDIASARHETAHSRTFIS